VGLYTITGTTFDYRPLLGFFIVTIVTGAGFISLGLFFSSLTRNQIVSGVLTFGALFVLFLVLFLKNLPDRNSVWRKALEHVSYIDSWINAINGKMQPATLLFSLSMAIFFLFETVKVLESRKWK
jgi:ABC-type transport system involved in multi-copper enzyme maturation permease subunit